MIADGLREAHASAVGDVVHVVGFRPTANGRGDQVLIRSRPSLAPQEIVLNPDIDILATTTRSRVITTVEGGAIVGSLFATFLVSSTSTTPVRLAGLTDPEGGVRGGHTVLSASSGLVYLYDEAGGTPTLTDLGTSNVSELHLLDPPASLPPTEWFTLSFGPPSNGCAFARIEVIGGVKQLATFPGCATEIAGTLADGTPVTRFPVWLLEAGGPVHIVDTAQLVFDPGAATPTVVGWTGFDALGGFTCMASDPDRCWGVPGDTFSNRLVFSSGTSSTDSVASVWLADDFRLYVVRSIGPGDRPRP
jgi:hypothetical protein